MSSYSTDIRLKMDYKLTFFLVAAFLIPVSNLCLLPCTSMRTLHICLFQFSTESYRNLHQTEVGNYALPFLDIRHEIEGGCQIKHHA